jgi:hypothetical protein
MYKILSIKQGGVDRLDGRYPLRIGCIGDIMNLESGFCMLFAYTTDQNGNPKEGVLRTSIVKDWRLENRCVIVNTLNSEYVLEELT